MPRIASLATLLATLLALCGVLALPRAAAAAPDWEAVADVGTIEVITSDADGDARETKVWLAVVDGQGFLRTGSSTWGDNLERDPNLVLRIEEREYPLRAEFIQNETLRGRVVDAFREKYGWSDRLIGAFRSSDPRILHLVPR